VFAGLWMKAAKAAAQAVIAPHQPDLPKIESF
jgi:hypothetical protein